MAAYLRHRRLTSVTIEPGDDYDGQCCLASHSREFLEKFAYDAMSGGVRPRAETQVIISYGGMVAEKIQFSRLGVGSDFDRHKIAGIVSQIVDEQERNAYSKWLLEHTRALLQFPMHWAGVQALAAELLEKRRLGERKARAVIKTGIQAWIDEDRASLIGPPFGQFPAIRPVYPGTP